MEDGLPKVNEDVCMGCGWCMGHCPVKDGGAIDMIRTDTGKVVWTGRGVHDKWVSTTRRHSHPSLSPSNSAT